MTILIPIICAILFWLGGRDQMKVPFNQKLFRWVGIGLFMGMLQPLIAGIYTAVAYFVATNVIGYGEKHPLRKWLGKDFQFVTYGFCFGTASLFALGLFWVPQAILAALCSWLALKWSNDGWENIPYLGKYIPALYGSKLNQNYVELIIGFTGTLLYAFIR